jgi:amphi-Trp domain-containing protein
MMAEIAAEGAAPKPAKPKVRKREERKPKSKQRIEFSSSMQRDEAIAYFEAIIGGLRKGALQFKQGGESLALTPPPYLEVDVVASRKADKEKVVFELSWRSRGGKDLTVT